MSESERLLAQFRSGLGQRREALQSGWNDGDEARGLDAVYRAAHNLAGAAGAYRLDGLHRLAVDLERGVRVWLKADAATRPPAAGLKRLLAPVWQALMAQIEHEIQMPGNT